MDLFYTIEDNHIIVYEIKALLKQLNNSDSHDSIANFILEFKPFLEKTAQNIKMKKEFVNRLKLQTDVISQQWDLVTQSQGWINEFEAKVKEDKDQVATHNASILSWTKQVNELQ